MSDRDGHPLLHPTRIDIPSEIRLYLLTLLNQTLACNVDLRSQVTQASWKAFRKNVEAFPWDEVPRYLLRDGDCVHGTDVRQWAHRMGLEEMLIAPRNSWQNPYVERLIGSIRRECLDQVVVLHERHLRWLLTEYFQHYHYWRTHRALDMDCPVPRTIQQPEVGLIKEVPEVGGLHHHDERRGA
jgi:putative transposase